ncbi:MAG: bifunctional proline dehydrogenase/L-glutamate gamma-semialdehyde dehydrogenase [Pseudomonadota bacterium]|nr:bifunctional proline dehydrogenase/L-glutamate gamma-semialdehyde dehydrogenase [Pseudomonadota bacterium]
MFAPNYPEATESAAARLRALLAEFRPAPGAFLPDRVQKAIYLARQLQQRANELQTPQEKKQQRELERMMLHPHDKATLIQMTDQALRSRRAVRAADQLIHILDVQGVPRFFTPLDQALLKGFQSFGSYLPGVAVPMVREKMREETANVILPAEEEHLLAHLRARHAAGLRMNVNLLGEALLGEEAAQARLETYLEALQRPEIECISVKISTIYSQISPLAWEDTIEVLCDRLELLYREAARMRIQRPDGSEVPKFVYLDMEEYRDMHLTAEAFMRTLGRPGMDQMGAGIALQAYLPDAFEVQKSINRWARGRVRAGGAPVTIRLVKGANMEMERVEAALHCWPQAPFETKPDVDANFKRMLHEGLRAENIAAVRIGIASHNLFDMAYGLVLAQERDALEPVQLEMLEGMANHQRRAISEVVDNLLLYAPATRREHFVNAIGYLVRRLDENTGRDNFLGHAFKLEVGSDEWERLAGQFIESFDLIDSLPEGPRRTQDRRRPAARPAEEDLRLEGFRNEPDTDFALPQNIAWACEIIERWKPRCDGQAAEIPLVVSAEEIWEQREPRECSDPSRPGVVVGRCREADEEDLARALDCARIDPTGWRAMAPKRRAKILGDVAQVVRERRADLMGAAMADGGKTFPESDPEVSEAVDFLEFYRRSALFFERMESVRAQPKGVVAVIPPWNFPIAIPCGGVAAALAAGNCVILKPASDAVLVAWELCKCFWQAGVPREVLQFLPCSGGGVGANLAAHPQVDAVILTGGTETALRMLEARPDMTLMAETGGKDATIVTAMADRDQAIRHVLQSAFSHSGQKCSATSLLILEEEVYEDAGFKAALCDAVKSLPAGSAWDRPTRVGPLIRPPTGALERGLKELEPGESWVLMPKRLEHNPRLWSPGIKWGVQAGSFTHMTELFGPVLGVMKARDLREAIDLVNQTGYGLTSGLESLDEREAETWQEQVRAGNLYINRVTTGAIVLRQPFGGMGKSSFGTGIKAGGPNYLAQLMDFEDRAVAASGETIDDPLLADLRDRLRAARNGIEAVSPEEVDRTLAAFDSYARNAREEFGREHDHFRLLGQDNIRRYRPVRELRIRLHRADGFFDLVARVAAASSLGCAITLSIPPETAVPGLDWLEQATEGWAAAIEFVEESTEELIEVMRNGQTERLRYASPERVPEEVHSAAKDTGVQVAPAPVLAEGRVELLWYLREQSISRDYHRYGNLGERGAEDRASVL